jgi:uncharacterized protein YbjT (DUF2867 family)
MNVLVTGATGFIGSAVVARLRADGHRVTAVVRPHSLAHRIIAADAIVARDIARSTASADWEPLLDGIDAVVNCAGLLQDRPSETVADVHVRGTGALFAACERKGVRRVIHVSAIGADSGSTPFMLSKSQADRALRERDLDWVILRPSVVVGRAAYGGSALFRGLAALPIYPLPPRMGPLQIVQLDDLLATIVFFLDPGAAAKLALDIAGPEPLALDEIIAIYRAWLGFRPAARVRVPAAAMSIVTHVGDWLGLLGWRPPLRSTASREAVRGAAGDTASWRETTGIAPRSLREALAAEPASVQERWFARLYLLKPVLLASLALFWTITGMLSLWPSFSAARDLAVEALGRDLAGAAVAGGALADIGIGLGMALRRTARLSLWLGIAVSLSYLAAGSILVPRLWLDPLGAFLKVVPIVALHLAALAIIDDR